MPTNISFAGRITEGIGAETYCFRYPWGEIPLDGTTDEIYLRFEEKGFKPEVIEEILFYLFSGVASKTTVSSQEVVDSQGKFLGGEVGEESGSENKFGIN
jgi:hypothetical protein